MQHHPNQPPPAGNNSQQQQQPPSSSNNHNNGPPPQSSQTDQAAPMIHDNNYFLSSLVFDRTIKLPRANYDDHGSHGVMTLPQANHHISNNAVGGMACVGGGGIMDYNGVAAAAGSSLPMAYSLSLQMQQLIHQQQLQQQQQQAALLYENTLRQQQLDHHIAIQQYHNNRMMHPPLPVMMGGGGSAYNNTNSIMGNNTVGSLQQQYQQQQLLDYSAMRSGGGIGSIGPSAYDLGRVGGGRGYGTSSMFNGCGTTSSTTLLHQLNAQLATNNATTTNNHHLATAMDAAMAGEATAARSNGKKRMSPSIPLHPSQLIGCCGAMNGGNSNNTVSMKSVAEEVDEAAALAVLHGGVYGVNHQGIAIPRGLLSTVLADQASTSQPSSIETKSSSDSQQIDELSASSSSSPNDVAIEYDRDKSNSKSCLGEVLTNPSVPSSNSGLDNVEGNLIVRRGDLLRISQKNIHSHPPPSSTMLVGAAVESSKSENSSNNDTCDNKDEEDKEEKEDHVEYRVISLLGQGTFAQVFQCIDEKSKKCVAVKIVKNKPAYTRQAAVEIDVFRKLNLGGDGDDQGENSAGDDGITNLTTTTDDSSSSSTSSTVFTNNTDKSTIRLMCYFMHSSHLCLVFEMLGPNLYELLKKRQFCGLPIGAVRSLVRQVTEGIKLLVEKSIVHCDLKPENILMVRSDVECVISECKKRGDVLFTDKSRNDSTRRGTTEKKATKVSAASKKMAQQSQKSNLGIMSESSENEEQWIKLIDFGSACFEGQSTYTYIQSRFYRSPEVLIGLPYDSAIDIWSLGCVAAELFLGLPILPGVHEHDQLSRILEMIGPMPEWMLEQGSKSGRFFKSRVPTEQSSSWEFRSRQEYISVLSEDEKQSKGGLSKLEQQQTNRYFKKTKLEDIVMHHGVCNTVKERKQLGLFVHFLKGVLEIDPWKRWTAYQASMHPFLTGSTNYRIKTASGTKDADVNTCLGVKQPYDIIWVPPWDKSISKRKLVVLQKTKEKAAQKQAAQVVANSSRCHSVTTISEVGGDRNPISQSVPEASAMTQSQMASMADALLFERALTNISGNKSPPSTLFNGGSRAMYNTTYPTALSASLGGGGMPPPLLYPQFGHLHGSMTGRSFSDRTFLEPTIASHDHNIQASLSDLYDTALYQQLLHPPPPTFMGAQSFSGAYYQQGMPTSNHPYLESDFGYALQRPGVVPGGDAFAAAYRRQTSVSDSAILASHQRLSSSLSRDYSGTAPPLPSATSNMNYQSTMSPGGLLLQKLGLQEQILLGSSNNVANINGGNGGVSLLARQLEEYSQLSGGGGVGNDISSGMIVNNNYNMTQNSNSGHQQLYHPNIGGPSCHYGYYDSQLGSIPYNIHNTNNFSDMEHQQQQTIQHPTLYQNNLNSDVMSEQSTNEQHGNNIWIAGQTNNNR